LAVENRKRMSTDASLSEVSPVKDSEKGAPGQEKVLRLQWQDGGVTEDAGQGAAKQKLVFDGGAESKYPPRSGTPPPPPSAGEQKRPKKQATPRKEKSEEEASGSEGRGAQ
jgi:hypothetical protein